MFAARAVLVALLLASGVACSSDGTDSADSAACADVTTISKQLNSISDDLPTSKQLFRKLARTSTNLVENAPDTLKSDAVKLRVAILKAKTYIDRAKTIEQLHRMEGNSPSLVNALNDLATHGVEVGEWGKAHC
jgi:hypothetical protein